MLPITGAYAMTCYKSQGNTYTNGIVDLCDLTANASPYVMLSRFKTKIGIRILRDFNTVPLNNEMKQDLTDNIEYIENLGLDNWE